MRPLKLRMTAFGPYGEIETVDFQELNGRNLFLVTGPTGSGKTTIFDAISFAMYGEASGSSGGGKSGRSAESLRSQYSRDDLLTEVELDFELKGTRYSVKRIPKQNKPKSRGEGFTEQKPEAELLIGQGQGRKVMTGVSRVNEKIESLMGINADQFRQIMMIPQGEFRQMLNSDSQDREKVLRKLFDTRLYNLMQMNLDMKSKALHRDIEDKERLRNYEAAKIDCGEDEVLEELVASASKNMDEIILRTLELIKRDEGLKRDMSLKIEGKNKEKEDLVSKREKAKSDNEKLKLKDSTAEEVGKLEERSAEIKDLKERIMKGEKAALILQHEKNRDERQKELDGIIEKGKKKEKELLEAKGILEKAEAVFGKEDSSESRAMREKLVEKLRSLKALEDKVSRIEAVSRSVEQMGKDAEIQHKKKETSLLNLDKTRKNLGGYEERLKKSGEAKTAQVRLRSEYKQWEEKRKNLEKIHLNFQEWDKVWTDLEKYRKTVEKEEQVLQSLDKVYKSSKLVFLRNQAALLAAELEEGKPCPVCGSLDHPSPALISGESISEDRINELEEDVKKQDKKVNDAARKVAVSEEKLKKISEDRKILFNELVCYSESTDDGKLRDMKYLEALSKEDMPAIMENCRMKLDDIAGEGKKMKALADEGNELEGKIKASRKNIEDLDKEIESLTATQLESAGKLSREKTKLEAIYTEVPEELRSVKSLITKMNEVATIKRRVEESYESARRNLESAKVSFAGVKASLEQLRNEEKSSCEKSEKAGRELKAKIISEGFLSFDDYVSSKMTADELEINRKIVEEHRRELHFQKQQYEKLVAETKGLQVASIEEFDKAVDSIGSAINEMIKTRSAIENRSANNSEIVESIKKIKEEIGDRENRYKVLGNLAAIAQGRNKGMITFERYVLAAFLDDILKAANIRLRKMSQGRFVLSRTEELERKNKQSGLELEVFDNYTGKSRHVKTLSGGEGFKASLSMALGLSDVVQSYAGGVQLDTMFIDEGFGTLDQESLDNAISCLIDLQESGRLVGIISHVQELKERIDTRLEVKSTNTGSTTEFVVM
ncbi:exonuclease SbcC [Dethiosulfatibacter aminovorans DSM 17477]|uniref:Nuclease SbcCD subunit C n=1 Tax=Dethiosulfatibacter aminovorans DSM 17477 TaxID=1121476 RepID=A0A1M6BX42_9FIRM|nr:AAA family ATPase [Dethiosulfatibacter aminovorans]SHI53345.1 exonuclease SbcC [Dethiosulfatibacter aminovorans DSM 17477]